MTTTSPSNRFAIGLSFPGEKREIVEEIATSLAAHCERERILYDKFHEAEFAQPDLDVYLPNLYRTQCELIVLFLCAEYATKRWCKLEWRYIRQLIATTEQHRIMLLSFDNIGAVPEIGILDGDGYAFIGKRTPQQIAALIIERWRLISNHYATTPPPKPNACGILNWFNYRTAPAKLGMVIGILFIVASVLSILGLMRHWLKHVPATKTLIADHGIVISDSTNAHVGYSTGDTFWNSPSTKVGVNYGIVIVNIPASAGFSPTESAASTDTNWNPGLLNEERQTPDARHRSDADTSQFIFKQLQTFLGPDGFTVKSPYPLFEEGKERGQVDIGIYGRVGAFAQSLWAVEFKKKQADDDVTWIQELRGKREQFNIQRMMAASTTGFSPAAIRSANKLGIELVRIDDREAVTITNWLQSIEFEFVNRYWETNGVVDVRTDPVYRRNESITSGRILREEGSTNLISVVEYMAPDVERLLDSLITNEVREVVLVYVTPAHDGQSKGSFSTVRPLAANDVVEIIPFKHPVDIAVDSRMSRLVGMSLPIKLRNDLVRGKVLLSVYRNMKDGSVLGMGGIISHMIPMANGFGQMRAKTLILLKDGNMQLKFLNENDEPIELAAGSRFEVWGRKQDVR